MVLNLVKEIEKSKHNVTNLNQQKTIHHNSTHLADCLLPLGDDAGVAKAALLVLGAVPLVRLGVVRDLLTLLGLVPTDGELRCCCLHSQEHSCRPSWNCRLLLPDNAHNTATGTRIFKFDLEVAEIIEVKVGTCNTKIIFLTQCNSKMSISK